MKGGVVVIDHWNTARHSSLNLLMSEFYQMCTGISHMLFLCHGGDIPPSVTTPQRRSMNNWEQSSTCAHLASQGIGRMHDQGGWILWMYEECGGGGSVCFVYTVLSHSAYAGKDENGLGWGSYRDWSWVFWCDQLAFKGQAMLYSRKSTLFYETWPFSKKLKTINTCVVWMLHFRLCAWSSSDKCNVNWGSLVREHRWFFKKCSLKQEGEFPVWALTMSIVILYFSMALRTANHCQSECSLLLTAVPSVSS